MTIATDQIVTPTITATLPVLLRATAPVHHGAGTSGNTAIFRMAEHISPAGESVRTPMISGNSIRHSIRAALAWDIVTTIGVPDGGLSKACVDLLWSGGALSAAGAQTDLAQMRSRHDLLPHLGLLGYSHGPDIITGTLQAQHAHLWCTENAWRMDKIDSAKAGVLLPAGEWIDEEFGTRHDIAGTAVDRLISGASAPATTQMIYDWQIVKAGSVWGFALTVNAATQPQVDSLVAAITRITASGSWPLAAKTGTGHGQTQILDLELTRLTPDPDAALSRWRDLLEGHAPAICDLLTGSL